MLLYFLQNFFLENTENTTQETRRKNKKIQPSHGLIRNEQAYVGLARSSSLYACRLVCHLFLHLSDNLFDQVSYFDGTSYASESKTL
jgi:hypothetical protein